MDATRTNPFRQDDDARIDPDGQVVRDVNCYRCGYNLLTLRLSAKCPECGEVVGATFEHEVERERRVRTLVKGSLGVFAALFVVGLLVVFLTQPFVFVNPYRPWRHAESIVDKLDQLLVEYEATVGFPYAATNDLAGTQRLLHLIETDLNIDLRRELGGLYDVESNKANDPWGNPILLIAPQVEGDPYRDTRFPVLDGRAYFISAGPDGLWGDVNGSPEQQLAADDNIYSSLHRPMPMTPAKSAGASTDTGESPTIE